MTSSTIDYIKMHFKYETLTKVHNCSTYDSLKTIKNKLKANASKVASNLGGGRHGHLGLVLTPAEYALVTAMPYIRPVFPGPLVLLSGAGMTNLQQEIAQDHHKEQMRVFCEVVDVEKALFKQFTQALPELYTKSFCNRCSNSITQNLDTVLTSFFPNIR